MGVVRPPKRRCGTCGWWESLSDPGELAKTGWCRRHPPVFCGEFDREGLPRFEWPETGVNATCGDWAKEDERYRERRPE